MTENQKQFKYKPDAIKGQSGGERRLHEAVAKRLDLGGHLWNHSPNGGTRSEREGASFKKQGVKAGWPDILIVDLMLVVELKTGYNKPTDEQLVYLHRFRDAGWQAWWVNSLDEFLDLYKRFI